MDHLLILQSGQYQELWFPQAVLWLSSAGPLQEWPTCVYRIIYTLKYGMIKPHRETRRFLSSVCRIWYTPMLGFTTVDITMEANGHKLVTNWSWLWQVLTRRNHLLLLIQDSRDSQKEMWPWSVTHIISLTSSSSAEMEMLPFLRTVYNRTITHSSSPLWAQGTRGPTDALYLPKSIPICGHCLVTPLSF